MLDLDLLHAFVAVAETGSFTAAADVVGRSQSAVSQKVLRLEDALGVRVFERTSRSLRLTQEGERVLAGGRRLLAQYDAFMREWREPQRVERLRLGVSEISCTRNCRSSSRASASASRPFNWNSSPDQAGTRRRASGRPA